jgi:hypothetical protein
MTIKTTHLILTAGLVSAFNALPAFATESNFVVTNSVSDDLPAEYAAPNLTQANENTTTQFNYSAWQSRYGNRSINGGIDEIPSTSIGLARCEDASISTYAQAGGFGERQASVALGFEYRTPLGGESHEKCHEHLVAGIKTQETVLAAAIPKFASTIKKDMDAANLEFDPEGISQIQNETQREALYKIASAMNQNVY